MSAFAPRPDARTKLEGSAVFGMDLDAPGMLWGALVPAPVAHGRLRTVDLEPARALEGVVAIGSADLPRLLPGATGDPDRPIFPTGTIFYRNQPVAAVAAPTREQARAAARAVRVEVDALSVVSDLEDVFPEWPGSDADGSPHVAAHVRAREGDIEAVFRTAERVVRETYRTSSIHQVAIEPHACLADTSGGRWQVRT